MIGVAEGGRMRILLAVTLATLPLAAGAQHVRAQTDPSREQVEVTGCVKGSTLTETSFMEPGDGRGQNPARRWRVRGPKPLMKQIKEFAGQELRIVGTMKTVDSGLMGGRRIGKTNIFIGATPNPSARDPLPEQPTIDVTSFKPTGERCH
jgi:hypothetical protein